MISVGIGEAIGDSFPSEGMLGGESGSRASQVGTWSVGVAVLMVVVAGTGIEMANDAPGKD